MFNRWLLSLIILMMTMSFSLAQEETDITNLDERGYGLYVPTTYDEEAEDPLPLIIALHGGGDTWENFYAGTGLIELAEQQNVIVAFPQGYENQWHFAGDENTEADLQIFNDLITRVDRDYRVDLDRVYLVGFSNGGRMAFYAACNASDVFAGVVSIAGTMLITTVNTCPEDVQIPMLIIHSADDTVVPFDGGGTSYPPPASTAFWANQNECNTLNVPGYEENFRNGFSNHFFDDCPNGNFVMLHVLQSVGHNFPGAQSYLAGEAPPPHLDTARLLWGFFELSYEAQQAQVEVTPEATETSDD